MIIFAGTLTTAAGQSERQDTKSGGRLQFDLPAQPLSEALHAFSMATGIEILVDARQVVGRQAPPLKGAIAPADALELLLAGSRLVAEPFGPETVTLKAAPMSPGPSSGGDLPYFALIQRAVQLALCSDAGTAPGRYRLALKIWIGRSGTVLQARRLDTTGDEGLDLALDAALRNLRIGTAPPPDLPQPVAVLISPQAGHSVLCPAGAPRLQRTSDR